MAYGVFRYYPPRYRSPRARIYTMPRMETTFRLPDPSVLDADGNRKHFYFTDYDDVRIKVKALAGDFIKLDAVVSASGGFILSTADGAACHVAAANDTTWKVLSYTLTWSVI